MMDFSKYLNKVLEVNAEEQWARVEPGIILDQLTRQVASHGLQYAPDPTTANRACVGGGIGTTPAARTRSSTARPWTTSGNWTSFFRTVLPPTLGL